MIRRHTQLHLKNPGDFSIRNAIRMIEKINQNFPRFLGEFIFRLRIAGCNFRYLLVMCFLECRYRLRMFVLKFRMRLCQTRIICLKRGYLAPNEGNLVSYFRYGGAAVNHPVKVVNVFLESSHRRQ